jgi:hypothetical protein
VPYTPLFNISRFNGQCDFWKSNPGLRRSRLFPSFFCTYIFMLPDPEFSGVLCFHGISSVLVCFYFVIDPGNNHTDHQYCHCHFHRIPSFFLSYVVELIFKYFKAPGQKKSPVLLTGLLLLAFPWLYRNDSKTARSFRHTFLANTYGIHTCQCIRIPMA